MLQIEASHYCEALDKPYAVTCWLLCRTPTSYWGLRNGDKFVLMMITSGQEEGTRGRAHCGRVPP